MKKTLAVGIISLAVAMLPTVLVSAATSQTDTLSVTINQNCTLERKDFASGGMSGNASHKNGSGTWSSDTLSATVQNSQVYTDLGSSQFVVVCNKTGSYSVTVATTSLNATGSLTIPNNTTYSSSVTGWSPIIDGSNTRLTNGATVASFSGTTGGTDIVVRYGVGISSSQPAGTYTGSATYSLTGI